MKKSGDRSAHKSCCGSILAALLGAALVCDESNAQSQYTLQYGGTDYSITTYAPGGTYPNAESQLQPGKFSDSAIWNDYVLASNLATAFTQQGNASSEYADVFFPFRYDPNFPPFIDPEVEYFRTYGNNSSVLRMPPPSMKKDKMNSNEPRPQRLR